MLFVDDTGIKDQNKHIYTVTVEFIPGDLFGVVYAAADAEVFRGSEG